MSFSGGSGIVSDPYLVASFADLILVPFYPDKHFRQVADIDCQSVPMLPLCESVAFSGSFIARGRVITNVNVQASGSACGFFHTIAAAGIVDGIDLAGTIDGGDEIGSIDTGGIAHTNNGIIRNCHNRAHTMGDVVGGICYHNEGQIDQCLVTGLVETDGGFVDPICGGDNNGSITHCYWDSDIITPSGPAPDGGLATAVLKSGALPENLAPAVWQAESGEYPALQLLYFYITASAGSGGSVTPAASAVASAASLTLIAVPEPGYTVSAWQLDGTPVQTGGQSLTIAAIDDDHLVSVSFAEAPALCTLSDVKQRLGFAADDSTHDELLAFIVPGMTAIFNTYCRRDLLATADDVIEHYTGEGPYLQLRRYPIVTITEIKEADDYDFDSADALEVDDDYRMVNMGLTGIVYNPSRWTETPDSIRVTYRGGYCAAGVSPASGEHALPADIREAAVMQCTLTFKRRDDIGLSGGSFTGASYSKFTDIELLPQVKETLDNYVRRTF